SLSGVSRPGHELDPALLEEALDSLRHEGIQVLSPEWRYLYVNEAVVRHSRKTREALLGKTMLECFPGIERTPLFSVLERCMRERSAETFETEFVYEDGVRAWFELRVRACRAGLIVASIDETERKRVELAHQETYQRALRDVTTPVVRLLD